MTTDQATAMLALLYVLNNATTNRDEKARAHIARANRFGREWKWSAAEDAIARAYRTLGAPVPDATGYDWHRGRHPLCLAIARAERQLGDG